MKIIDAHLHLFSEDSAEEMARQVADGTITDGITLAAYLQYLCRKGKV